MDSVFAYAITAILGGGLFKGIEALYRAITDSREKKTLADAVGAKTPSEVESVSVTTMTAALKSAQSRIEALESERSKDRSYYEEKIANLEQEREEDRIRAKERIDELNDQLERMRAEIGSMEQKLAELLEDTSLQPRQKEEEV